MSVTWDRPSPRVADLIRDAATTALELPEQLYDQIDAAVLAQDDLRELAEDPLLHAALRRTNRSNLTHWLQSNVHEPGRPVPANLGPEPLGIARDLVRRGFDDSALQSYRVGQNVAWRLWMGIVFRLTRDPAELHELLDITAASIASYIDAQIEQIMTQIQAERDELTRGTHADRREVVALLLDGAPIGSERASLRLGYTLERTHTAAVVWSEEPSPDREALEHAVDALVLVTGAVRPLTVIGGAPTLWVWLPRVGEVDPDEVAAALGEAGEARIAVGRTADGVEGFRTSHLDALAVQRLMVRGARGLRVAGYDDVRLVTLVTHDEARADEFVRETLGGLEAAAAELRETVLAHIESGSSATRAAERLGTHRNTVLRRLARAEELLPRPLGDDVVAVAVALEVVRWRAA